MTLMTYHLVFTEQSLEAAIQSSSDADWLRPDGPALDPSSGVVRVSQGVAYHFVHRNDSSDSPLVVVPIFGSLTSLDRLPNTAWRGGLQRMAVFARKAHKPPVHLPALWSEYHMGNLVAFFACVATAGSFRWVAEIHPSGRKGVCFWRVTDESDEVDLRSFRPPQAAYLEAVAKWSESVEKAATAFAALPKLETHVPLGGVIDLQAASYGAVVGHLGYSAWLGRLDAEQRRFIEHPIDQPLKLRGPAGTGKTLALELKALREVYAARSTGEPFRVLFATHSWAVAEQVDMALRALDETGTIEEISVFPLLEMAKAILPKERQASGVKLLGEDSLSGRRHQLRRVGEALARMKRSDWLAYEGGASPEFRERIGSAEGTPAWNAIVWDLMHEFGSVLAAAAILPGITAEKRYLALRRGEWMMPLRTDAEKKFVLRVYGDYVALLRKEHLLASDQLINDFLSYLETFAWDHRRTQDGYDLIFVDELHLFSDPERLALTYLARESSKFPRMFMALDPRQSPSEVYADFSVADVSSTASEEPEQTLGNVEAMDLKVVHRFSPPILELVKFLQNSFPVFDLGTDWAVDVESLRSVGKEEEVPTLYRHADTSNEIASVIRRARERSAGAGGSSRSAVILVDSMRLHEFGDEVSQAKLPVVVLESRDDVDAIRYSKRSVVFSAAEYVAGLQFDDVIVAGFPSHIADHVSSHERRRLLSLLYLAISRASKSVEVHVHADMGEFATFIDSAVTAGVLRIGA
jgi:hypothetical protein